MIPTPDLSHLTCEDYEHVYEPAEDTFLLLDALEQDAVDLQLSRPTICLEIGSGSGCVSAFLAKILVSKALFLCTDVNSYASHCTLRTGHQNSVKFSAHAPIHIDIILTLQADLQPVVAFLADPLLARLRHNVDVLLFNPPYVPTISEEWESAQAAKSLDGAWAGGTDGMQLTNKLLINVDHLLSPNGKFYLVALKANGIENVRQRMQDEFFLASEACMRVL